MAEWTTVFKSKSHVHRPLASIATRSANMRDRGALDFNPLSTIASHLQYWADEDVAHFLTSQLLSRKSAVNEQQGK